MPTTSAAKPTVRTISPEVPRLPAGELSAGLPAVVPPEPVGEPVVFAHLRGHGWRAYYRFFQIVSAAAVFAFPILIRKFIETDPARLPNRRRRFAHRLATLFFKNRIGPEATSYRRQAARLRETMVRLGPTFIKIGQMLSIRGDLLPFEYTQELTALQDEVPPFSNDVAWARIREELGDEPRNLFLSIERRPLAAASLGQVYRARLKDGTEVVVKVQRPNLPEIIRLDMTVLRTLAAFVERQKGWVKAADWPSVVEEFGWMLMEETDYEKEIENAERFRENFAMWRKDIHIPRIFPELSSRRVITMEYVAGVKPTDIEKLKKAGFDPQQKMTLLVRTYLKQLLEDGFFHADPHPGNLRIMEDGRLAFFDFGMVGQITEEMRVGMLDAFFHVTDRDLVGLVGDAIALGFLQPGYDLVEFQAATQAIFLKYKGRKLSQLTFSELNETVSETLYNFPFRIPGSFTFVVRALMTLEGMGTLTDPQFNLFDTAKPHAKEFLLKRATAHLRDQVIGKLLRGEEVKVGWEKIWNVARLAYRTYFKKPPTAALPPKN